MNFVVALSLIHTDEGTDHSRINDRKTATLASCSIVHIKSK